VSRLIAKPPGLDETCAGASARASRRVAVLAAI
jgi:hypothetical protein